MGSGKSAATPAPVTIVDPPEARVTPTSVVQDYNPASKSYQDRVTATPSPQLLTDEEQQKKTDNLLG